MHFAWNRIGNTNALIGKGSLGTFLPAPYMCLVSIKEGRHNSMSKVEFSSSDAFLQEQLRVSVLKSSIVPVDLAHYKLQIFELPPARHLTRQMRQSDCSSLCHMTATRMRCIFAR